MPASPMMEEYEDSFGMNTTNITDQFAAYGEEYTLGLVIPLTITYTIIFIAGILGNTCTCVVIARNRVMHNVTNFYLFSLAISDLIFLVCGVPFELYKLWNPITYPLVGALCIAIGLASETSANAIVLLMTAFTVERYLAICRPFMSRTMSTSSKVVRIIIGIWISAVLTAVPQALQLTVESFMENEQRASACTVKGVGVRQVFVIASFISFMLPMSVIFVLNTLICIKLRTSRVLVPVKKRLVDSNERAGELQNRNAASQNRVIRMLIMVALSFFFCWAPFHVQRLLTVHGKTLEYPSDTYYMAYFVLTFLSGVLCYLSTAINPFLYNIMSNKFRKAFMVTFASWCGGDDVGRSPCLRRTSATNDQRVVTGVAGSRARARSARYSRRLRAFSTAAMQDDTPPRVQCRMERELVRRAPRTRTMQERRSSRVPPQHLFISI